MYSEKDNEIIDNNIRMSKEKLFNRQRAYQLVFSEDTPEGRALLKDLTGFCRAQETTFSPDPRVSALLEGRREVFLRINDHIRMSSDELWNKYGKGEQRP